MQLCVSASAQAARMLHVRRTVERDENQQNKTKTVQCLVRSYSMRDSKQAMQTPMEYNNKSTCLRLFVLGINV